jgi:hypothetical protein
MIVKIKKQNYYVGDFDEVKELFVDTNNVIAVSEVITKKSRLKADDEKQIFQIWFNAKDTWDVLAECYDDFVAAWTYGRMEATKMKPLYS